MMGAPPVAGVFQVSVTSALSATAVGLAGAAGAVGEGLVSTVTATLGVVALL